MTLPFWIWNMVLYPKEMENNIRAAIISELVPIVRVRIPARPVLEKLWILVPWGTSTPDTECPAGGEVIQRAKFSPKANEAYAASLGQQTTLL